MFSEYLTDVYRIRRQWAALMEYKQLCGEQAWPVERSYIARHSVELYIEYERASKQLARHIVCLTWPADKYI